MRNFKLELSYDGGRYRGWQRLGNTDNTIQGKLETVITRMLGCRTEVIGSGRTDAGVHAMHQIANFHGETDMTTDEICTYLRKYLPEDIGILSVTEVSPRFHSRLNAVSKTYRYRIWNSSVPCVFERKYVWQVEEKLNVEYMQQAAEYFLGTHDFIGFCSNKHFKKSSDRTIYSLSVEPCSNELVITVSSNGFLYNMVRIIVGTLVAVGRGELRPDQIPAIIDSKSRENAGITAPPQGLCLMEVFY